MGFEPTWLLTHPLSRRRRYDRFGTSPWSPQFYQRIAVGNEAAASYVTAQSRSLDEAAIEKLHIALWISGNLNLVLCPSGQVAYNNRHVDATLPFDKGAGDEKTAVNMAGIGHPGSPTPI